MSLSRFQEIYSLCLSILNMPFVCFGFTFTMLDVLIFTLFLGIFLNFFFSFINGA